MNEIVDSSSPLTRTISDAELCRYIRDGESIEGLGYGGSESLTLFVSSPRGKRIVRKILSERLVTPAWDRDGGGVMLPPCAKARRQTEYLRGLPPAVQPYFPMVLDQFERQVGEHHEFIYDMTFVPGIEISRFIRQHRPPARIVALLYSEIFRLLRDKVHAHRRRVPNGPTIEASYLTKIESRLALAASTAPLTFNEQLLSAEHVIINGRWLKNVPALLCAYRESDLFARVLEPRFHSLVMGDTNTENIKIGNTAPLLRRYNQVSFEHPPFTAEELELRFLDPRAIGFHENGIDSGADDPMYDNKPWHNSLGNYDQIHGEHFDLEFFFSAGTPAMRIQFHEHSPYAASYRGIARYFAEAMNRAWRLDSPNSEIHESDPYWVIRFAFVMGTHFMAMPPFHFSKDQNGVLVDGVQHQRRPLALYAEGVKWLNLALDMLEGRVTNFLGVVVPRIRSRQARVHVA
ncbi:MAG: hypothetical protein JO270_25625 [Acidobacteriaceae bacterium]|nr:hypothetical protein [Acidobacteriaceae bacterium]